MSSECRTLSDYIAFEVQQRAAWIETKLHELCLVHQGYRTSYNIGKISSPGTSLRGLRPGLIPLGAWKYKGAARRALGALCAPRQKELLARFCYEKWEHVGCWDLKVATILVIITVPSSQGWQGRKNPRKPPGSPDSTGASELQRLPVGEQGAHRSAAPSHFLLWIWG